MIAITVCFAKAIGVSFRPLISPDYGDQSVPEATRTEFQQEVDGFKLAGRVRAFAYFTMRTLSFYTIIFTRDFYHAFSTSWCGTILHSGKSTSRNRLKFPSW